MASIISATTTNGLSTSADNSGSLQLATNNGTTALTIDTSQNVGIGTTSPTSIVETAKAAGNTQIRLTESSDSGSDTALFFARRSRGTSLSSPTAIQSGNNMGGLAIGAYNGTSYAIGSRIIGISNQTWTGSAQGTNLTFSTTADGATSDTERMRIDSSGNLLVNTTSLNSGKVNIVASGASQPCMVLNDSDATSGSQGILSIRRNNSAVGLISTTNTNTTYATSSDYRLKEDIAPMTGALAKVTQLKPCSWTWKLDGSAGQGFIAHELQEFVPDCVSGEKDAVDKDGKPVYQGIDTSFLVATLTAALQEAHGLIKDLQARVETLEAK